MLKKHNFITLASLVFLLLISATFLQEVKAWGETTPSHAWPYDCCSRCEHTGSLGYRDDTFCLSSIEGWYDQNTITPAAYIRGTWQFWRGYGGGGEAHDYITDSPMYCSYAYGNPTIQYSTVHYEYNSPYYRMGPPPDYIYAYYQNYTKTYSSFSPARETQLQGGAQSYFKDPNNPSNRWYVSAVIGPSYMTARYP